MKEAVKQSLPISISLLPTLVFGLVIIDILKTSGALSNQILGGLIIYTIIITILPSLLLLGKKDLKRGWGNSFKRKYTPLGAPFFIHNLKSLKKGFHLIFMSQSLLKVV